MTDTLTRITLPEQKNWSGILDWGRLTPDEMIRQARSYAAHLRAQADAIDAATDSEFEVVVVKGARVQRHQETLQKSTRRE
jgi:hypothetical protein